MVLRTVHPDDRLPRLDAPEDHAAPSRRLSRGAWIRVAIASLATIVGVTAWQMGFFAPGPEPTRAVAPPPVAAPVRASNAPAASPSTAAAAPVDRGFANPAARCDGLQQMVAAGRTPSSLAVICREPNGGLVYKGVRLSLGTGTQVDLVTDDAGTFVARNETATYTLSPRELVIAAANVPVIREPIIEYRTPRPPAAAVAPRPAPAVSAPRPIPAAAAPAAAAPAAPIPAAAAPAAAPKAPPRAVVPPKQPPTPAVAPFAQTGTGTGELSFTADQPWRLHYSMTCPNGTPVGGFLRASDPTGSIYYIALHGGATDSDETTSGSSLQKTTSGQVVVDVNPGDEACQWTVDIR